MYILVVARIVRINNIRRMNERTPIHEDTQFPAQWLLPNRVSTINHASPPLLVCLVHFTGVVNIFEAEAAQFQKGNFSWARLEKETAVIRKCSDFLELR